MNCCYCCCCYFKTSNGASVENAHHARQVCCITAAGACPIRLKRISLSFRLGWGWRWGDVWLHWKLYVPGVTRVCACVLSCRYLFSLISYFFVRCASFFLLHYACCGVCGRASSSRWGAGAGPADTPLLWQGQQEMQCRLWQGQQSSCIAVAGPAA